MWALFPLYEAISLVDPARLSSLLQCLLGFPSQSKWPPTAPHCPWEWCGAHHGEAEKEGQISRTPPPWAPASRRPGLWNWRALGRRMWWHRPWPAAGSRPAGTPLRSARLAGPAGSAGGGHCWAAHNKIQSLPPCSAMCGAPLSEVLVDPTEPSRLPLRSERDAEGLRCACSGQKRCEEKNNWWTWNIFFVCCASPPPAKKNEVSACRMQAWPADSLITWNCFVSLLHDYTFPRRFPYRSAMRSQRHPETPSPFFESGSVRLLFPEVGGLVVANQLRKTRVYLSRSNLRKFSIHGLKKIKADMTLEILWNFGVVMATYENDEIVTTR